jgi:TPR repeat protein
VHFYAQASRGGNRDAMYLLGVLYYRGEGVDQNRPHAAELFRWAAERGQLDAQDVLGDMLLHGLGVPRDEKEAFRWFSRAATSGHSDAQFGVAKDPALAVDWYRKSAERNDPEAMTQLGFHLRQGSGVAWNEAEAMHWFRKAAVMHNVDAQVALAWGYMHGLGGGPQDYAAAAAWFTRAAEKGSAAAQLNLGTLYERGWAAAQDRPGLRLGLRRGRPPGPLARSKAALRPPRMPHMLNRGEETGYRTPEYFSAGIDGITGFTAP